MTIQSQQLIADRLATAREKAGLKQDQVAEILDVQSTTISAWENARKGMSLDMVFKLASLYNVPPAFFFPKHTLPTSPSSEDLLRDAIIQKVEGLDPIYLSLLDEVVGAFENHDVNKGVGFFRSLLEDIDSKD